MRRGNNEGTIYKRSDGRWEAAISLGNGDRRSFYAKTKQEAAAKLHQALRNLQDGRTRYRSDRQYTQMIVVSRLAFYRHCVERRAIPNLVLDYSLCKEHKPPPVPSCP